MKFVIREPLTTHELIILRNALAVICCVAFFFMWFEPPLLLIGVLSAIACYLTNRILNKTQVVSDSKRASGAK